MRSLTIGETAACLLLCCGLVGCDSTDGSAPESPAYDTSDPDQLDPFVTELVWSVDETIAQVETALMLGYPNPEVPIDAYIALLRGRDASCPNAGDQLIAQEMPTGGCTAASGIHYYGNTTLVSSFVSDPKQQTRIGVLGGDFEIEDASGHTLAGGGIMSYQVIVAGGATQWMGESSGSWIDDSRDDVFGGGMGAILRFSGTSGKGDNGEVQLSGTLGVQDVYLEFVDVAWAASCRGYPAGSVRIRDPSGSWATFEYSASCDGCGTYTVDLTGVATDTCLNLEAYRAGIVEIGR